MKRRSITNTQQVARAGEHFVAGELHRRGAYAVTFAGNMPKIDVLASDKQQLRTVFIQIKTKSGASRGWQTSITAGQQRDSKTDETRYWVLADLKWPGEAPDYFIIPEWWIQNDIYTAHQQWLVLHSGVRPRTPGSTHHLINRERIEEWRDRWDILGIFPESTED